jgi:hypothetical protein
LTCLVCKFRKAVRGCGARISQSLLEPIRDRAGPFMNRVPALPFGPNLDRRHNLSRQRHKVITGLASSFN